MKTISKALIAVMVAAAMCLVPVFAIADGSDAAGSLTDGSSGVSFKGSMSDTDFNKLVTDEYKEEIASMVLETVVADDGSLGGVFTISDLTVSDVSDIKLSKGMKIDGDKITNVSAQALKCKIKFTATFDGGLFSDTATLFNLYDGNQVLYNEIGSNVITDGNVLKFDGTVTLDMSASSTSTMAKNGNDNYVATEVSGKMSKSESYSGELKFNNGTAVKTIDLDVKQATSSDATITLDYGDVKMEDVVSGTKVIIGYKDIKGASEQEYKYTVNDKKGGYDYKVGADYGMPAMFTPATVADLATYQAYLSASFGGNIVLYVDSALKVPEYKYYIALDMGCELCLFNMGMVKSDYQDDTKLGTFLNSVGTADETSFSDADSVADSAYSAVSEPGNGGSGSNLIFYVIIGVLAVAVVALAVLAFKKK